MVQKSVWNWPGATSHGHLSKARAIYGVRDLSAFNKVHVEDRTVLPCCHPWDERHI